MHKRARNIINVVEANDFSMTLWFSVSDDQEKCQKRETLLTQTSLMADLLMQTSLSSIIIL